jgi:hypothetical protein
MKTKTCPRCKERRPVEWFARNVHTDDGLQIHCRQCQREQHEEAIQSPRVRIGLACGMEGNNERQFKWRDVLATLRDKFKVPV